MALSDEAKRWREACRRAVARQKELLRSEKSQAARTAETAVGAGGDVTLAIDRDFEAIALEEIGALVDADGQPTIVVSEERGEAAPDAPNATRWVILDPIDGSTNIANGLPQFSLSLAVASGPTMADVWFGFVFDFGTNEEFVCERNTCIQLNGTSIGEPSLGASRLIGCESAEPALLAAGLEQVAATGAKEIRVVGSIAIALCYVAVGRFDGLMTCRQCRSVDAAAGQLMAVASNARVLFDGRGPEETALALSARYRLVAGHGGTAPALRDAQQTIPLVPR